MKNKNKLFAKKDFDISSLPTTRKDSFKDVYRNNFLNILKCGLVLLLFALPLIGFYLFMDIGHMGMTLENYTEEQLTQVLLTWDIFVNAGTLLLLPLLLVGISGVFKVIKLLIWQEGVDFWRDFRIGIKENYKDFMIMSGVFAFIYAATYFVMTFFLDGIFYFFVLALFVLLLLPICLWSYFVINVYKTKMWDYFKNGVFFSYRHFGFTILFIVMVSFPFFAIYLPFSGILYLLIKYTLIIVLLIFYYPCILIVWHLFACAKFDKFINKDHYPEVYEKGLYKINKDEKNI